MKIINLDGRRNVSGERVRQMRTKKRMTQADLAAKVQTTGVTGGAFAGGLFVLLKMHKITQNSLLKKHGIFCLTFSN